MWNKKRRGARQRRALPLLEMAWLGSLLCGFATLSDGVADATCPELEGHNLVLRVVEDDHSEGSTIAGARVWAFAVMDADQGENPLVIGLAESISDERGELQLDLSALEDLPEIDKQRIEIKIHAHRQGYDSDYLWTDVTQAAQSSAASPGLLELQRGAERLGRVQDDQGTGLARVTVYIEVFDELDGSWKQSKSIQPDEAGYFTWTRDQSRPRRAIAEHAGQGTGSADIKAGGALMTLVVRPGVPVIRGRVLAANDTPLPGRVLYASQPLEGESEPLRWASLQTDEDGNFEFHPPAPGMWSLELSIDVKRASATEPVLAEAGNQAVLIRDRGTFLLVATEDDGGRSLNSLPPIAFKRDSGWRKAHTNLASEAPTNGIFAVDGAHHAERVTDGLWLIEVPGAGEYFVQASGTCGAGHAKAVQRVEVRESELQRLTLVVQSVARAYPMELSVLDVMGAATEAWCAVLYNAQTGRFVERFGSQGVLIPYCLGDPTFGPLAVPVGDYDLVLWPAVGSYMLPARARIQLREVGPNQPLLQFPEFGGLVQVECDGLGGQASQLRFSRSEPTSEAQTFHPQRLKLTESGARSMLLAAGVWQWQRLSREGQVLDQGSVEVRAQQEVQLVL